MILKGLDPGSRSCWHAFLASLTQGFNQCLNNRFIYQNSMSSKISSVCLTKKINFTLLKLLIAPSSKSIVPVEKRVVSVARKESLLSFSVSAKKPARKKNDNLHYLAIIIITYISHCHPFISLAVSCFQGQSIPVILRVSIFCHGIFHAPIPLFMPWFQCFFLKFPILNLKGPNMYAFRPEPKMPSDYFQRLVLGAVFVYPGKYGKLSKKERRQH